MRPEKDAEDMVLGLKHLFVQIQGMEVGVLLSPFHR